MTEDQAREWICEIGRRIYAKGFAAANDGNISYRLSAHEILCTPTMVCKGFMKPADLCVVDNSGQQLRGERRRTSEILLHLAIYQARPDVHAVVHCHPPHATAFAIAQEPIPKCILPEVEVFLGEIPMSPYETPGTQQFAETVLPFVKHCNTIILANHGTVSFGPTLENAYWNTEIVDAYCRMLILARQLGRVNYLSAAKTWELLALKKRLGYGDVRFEHPDCDICGRSTFRRGYGNFVPEPLAFVPPIAADPGAAPTAVNVTVDPANTDVKALVQLITEQVLAALAGKGKD
jgi:L-fuculose-phosphate aldolase